MERLYDDTFLARWADGRLSEEELKAFKESEDYELYVDTMAMIETASFPDFDIEGQLDQVMGRIKASDLVSDRPKGQLRPMNIIYALAACILLFIGLRFVFGTIVYETGSKESLAIVLPDGSSVSLNADSELRHDRFGWNEERTVRLNGEAFFEVEKGSEFKVETPDCEVVVLGTRFTVLSRDGYREVECYQGRVSVEFPSQDALILEKGKAIRNINGESTLYDTSRESADWDDSESSFEQVPILYVIEEMERQFGIEVIGKNELGIAPFTGRFEHQDLKVAASTVFGAMGIQYSIDVQGNVLLDIDK